MEWTPLYLGGRGVQQELGGPPEPNGINVPEVSFDTSTLGTEVGTARIAPPAGQSLGFARGTPLSATSPSCWLLWGYSERGGLPRSDRRRIAGDAGHEAAVHVLRQA